ncbi:hypothetical protein Cch01nite_22880 [Cellulomonas chitinilytica]|uniref:Histidine kinase n=1 Tax=Cellulomonas chitinilytica TaxID=398759 RepID=A0A919U2X2_9CELL|nr:histidine kinase [Cellulomonas chitinilytica]GIG21564.1 hypothetical protein Cch01nite_22880 [Cellulomonas chitinilytica]
MSSTEPTTPAQPDEAPVPETVETSEPVGSPEPVEAPVPTEAELVRDAQPATVRHAPKFGAFITAGALVGIVVALVLTQAIQPELPRAADGSGFLPFLDGENAVRTVMAVSGAVLGGFVGGLLAVVADRRSVRRARRAD